MNFLNILLNLCYDINNDNVLMKGWLIMSRKVIYVDFKCNNNKKPFLSVLINKIKNCFIKSELPKQVDTSNTTRKIIDYDKYML